MAGRFVTAPASLTKSGRETTPSGMPSRLAQTTPFASDDNVDVDKYEIITFGAKDSKKNSKGLKGRTDTFVAQCADSCFNDDKDQCQWFAVSWSDAIQGQVKGSCMQFTHLQLQQKTSKKNKKFAFPSRPGATGAFANKLIGDNIKFGFLLAPPATFLTRKPDCDATFAYGKQYTFCKTGTTSYYLSSKDAACAAVPVSTFRAAMWYKSNSRAVTGGFNSATLVKDFSYATFKKVTKGEALAVPTTIVSVTSADKVSLTNTAGRTRLTRSGA